MSRKNTTKKAKLAAPRHSIRRRKTAKPTVAAGPAAPVIPPAMTLVACPMCGVSVFRAGMKGHLIYACPLRGSDAANAALLALDAPPETTAGQKARGKRSRTVAHS